MKRSKAWLGSTARVSRWGVLSDCRREGRRRRGAPMSEGSREGCEIPHSCRGHAPRARGTNANLPHTSVCTVVDFIVMESPSEYPRHYVECLIRHAERV